MTKQTNPIETAIAEYLTSHGVTFTATGGTATKRDDWECDHWSVSFTRHARASVKGSILTLITDYYTGVGHRQLTAYGQQEVRRYTKATPNRIAQVKKENSKAVAPHVAGVLYSLLLDSSSAEGNFHDWCDEFGYDKDSIKAQGMYNACCETLTKMRSFFTREERQEMQEILQDY